MLVAYDVIFDDGRVDKHISTCFSALGSYSQEEVKHIKEVTYYVNIHPQTGETIAILFLDVLKACFPFGGVPHITLEDLMRKGVTLSTNLPPSYVNAVLKCFRMFAEGSEMAINTAILYSIGVSPQAALLLSYEYSIDHPPYKLKNYLYMKDDLNTLPVIPHYKYKSDNYIYTHTLSSFVGMGSAKHFKSIRKNLKDAVTVGELGSFSLWCDSGSVLLTGSDGIFPENGIPSCSCLGDVIKVGKRMDKIL
jgi:hypothetical protein